MNTSNFILCFLGIGAQELLVIGLVVLLLFGGRKIPELMRGLGKGIKSFKDGLNDISDNSNENKQQ